MQARSASQPRSALPPSTTFVSSRSAARTIATSTPGRDNLPRAALANERLSVEVGARAEFKARPLAPRRAHGLERAQQRARRMLECGLDIVLVAGDVFRLEQRLCEQRRAFRLRNGPVGARVEQPAQSSLLCPCDELITLKRVMSRRGDERLHALASHAAEELVCQAAEGTVGREVVCCFHGVHEFFKCHVGNGIHRLVSTLADGGDDAHRWRRPIHDKDIIRIGVQVHITQGAGALH
eukprot:scaffold28711_cov65-Phaeocystis_antarctica.AAC.5